MATKKDLIEAQGFSRRRLLSAFTGGAPGGKELDPAKPLRAVIAGIALTAMVILAGVFYGLVKPGLPQGWEDNRLVLVSDTGARYITAAGVLHPVINTASARLLVPAGKFSVISTDRSTIADVPIGSTVGIVGAPDDLPSPKSLVSTGWTACAADDAQTAVSISADPVAKVATDTGTVVSRGGDLFVVAGGHRFAVDAEEANAVLRAVGLGGQTPTKVDGRWLTLFQPGDDLAPLQVDGSGGTVDGTKLEIGSVIHQTGTPDDERYLVSADGQLDPLSPLAYQLYLLGDDASDVVEVSPTDIASLATATTPAGGVDWPSAVLTPIADDSVPCALMTATAKTAETALATAPQSAVADVADRPVSVDVGAGALVQASKGAPAFLVDGTGTAYAIPNGDSDTIQRLGYATSDVSPITAGWVDLLPVGPSLTADAAGTSPAVEAAG